MRSPLKAAGGDRRLPQYAVIMAGGQGTRFWPRSRRRLPKQLLAITGRRSLLQETAHRLRPLFSWRTILVVTNAEHAAAVRRQLPQLAAEQILVEPVGRNTLPCAALAAEWIAARAPDALMVLVPADHLIRDGAGLRHCLRTATALARRHPCLVTLGIVPTRPETGYGYIEIGSPIGNAGAARWVRRFHEKPAAPVARRYVAGRRHLWNAGMFVWRLRVFRTALAHCAPAVSAALAGVWRPDRGRPARLARAYRRVPNVSVDVALLQPLSTAARATARVAVVPARFDWNDVGSWVAMPELWGRDAAGNATLGKLLSIDAAGSIVYCPERLVALIGVEDLIVVDSPDALLICARDRAQDVRQVPHRLRERGWTRYL